MIQTVQIEGQVLGRKVKQQSYFPTPNTSSLPFLIQTIARYIALQYGIDMQEAAIGYPADVESSFRIVDDGLFRGKGVPTPNALDFMFWPTSGGLDVKFFLEVTPVGFGSDPGVWEYDRMVRFL